MNLADYFVMLDMGKTITRLTAQLEACKNQSMDESNLVVHLQAQLSERDAEIEKQQAEIEQLRVQLAGCGVAAMCNTRESMQQQLCRKGDYGYSASYQDVIDAVNREIALREENAALRKEVERLQTILGAIAHETEMIHQQMVSKFGLDG